MSHLVLVRHGQSEWNEKNLFTGWRDPDLTAQGIDEAKAAGRALKQQGLVFDLAFHPQFWVQMDHWYKPSWAARYRGEN